MRAAEAGAACVPTYWRILTNKTEATYSPLTPACDLKDVNVKTVLQFNQAVSYVSNKPISQWIKLETDYGSKIYVDSHFATNIKADGTSETQVTITPQKTLQTGTHYTLIIPAGSLKLRNGSQNCNEHRIGFTTKDVNTSIANPVLKESKKGQVFDMSGRRLNAPKKGINIINGKKYICRQ